MSNLTQAVKRSLLADDDLDDNVVFMDVVNEIDNQINVSIVNDGEELIRTIVENAPNILFLDVFLPFKDGRSCLREIRAMSELKGLPIIMFSALQSDEVIESFYRDGANAYLVKPDTVRELSFIGTITEYFA
ncbi:response regulator [Chitinophaga sancti]|uniref:response regulator n=1 Tax=Chitinophaga sancti TaxID=1004 RepID=UPI002A761F31|nr:response regulator [Chitinophaga sancti]WPQ66049.1 response regulator [Chitinophaga sancti]